MRSLAERLRAYEQQKARLAETEAKLKEAEKRARTRRLIEVGGIAERAGLAELPTAQLYGALLSLRGSLNDAKHLDQWAVAGSQAMLEEDETQEENFEPIVLTFSAKPDKEASALLRSGGFRFNKVFGHWEGFGQLEAAQQLAADLAGEARKVSSAPAAPQRPSAPSVADPEADAIKTK